MSPSFMKKTMVYLGLLDDEYDEYDDLEDRAPRGFSAATRVEPRSQDHEQAEEFSGGMSRVRTIPRESAQPSQQPRSAPSNVAPRPSAVRAVPVDPTMNPTGRRRRLRRRCTWSPRPGSATPRRSPTA